MLRIGLTGGIASGKTTVCGFFRANGFRIIDADRVAHDLLRKGKNCYEPVVAAFGAGILAADGEIDRGKLGSVVFANPSLLARLNELTHPVVIDYIQGELATLERQNPQDRVIVDASLMIESGFHSYFKDLVVVYCRPDQQVARLMKRSGLTEAQARQRIALQMPLEEKKRYATAMIDSSGPLEETRRQVDLLIQSWSAV